MSKELLFFTCVNRKYEYFIGPFLHFARLSNPGARFEIMVEDPSTMPDAGDCRFRRLNGAPDRSRFVEKPETESEYVYVSDIDIMITDPVPEFHIQRMEITGFPFSNIRRPNRPAKMSGLHFARAKAWYKRTERYRRSVYTGGPKAVSSYRNGLPSGEEVLFCMTMSAYPGFAISGDCDYRFRPVHGIHCSPNRPFDGGVSWCVNSDNLKRFKAMAKTLSGVDTRFKTKYLDVLMALDLDNHEKVEVL